MSSKKKTKKSKDPAMLTAVGDAQPLNDAQKEGEEKKPEAVHAISSLISTSDIGDSVILFVLISVFSIMYFLLSTLLIICFSSACLTRSLIQPQPTGSNAKLPDSRDHTVSQSINFFKYYLFFENLWIEKEIINIHS